MTHTLIDALSAPDSSTRLQAALAAGTRTGETDTHSDAAMVDELIRRSGVEPDFFVRDMLTWALTRMHPEQTVPRLVEELTSSSPQARGQALHTLSKIGDRAVYPHVVGLLHDADDEVARTAWRAAVAFVSEEGAADLVADLVTELGRGDHEVRRSLSRALAELGTAAEVALSATASSNSEAVRVHAAATRRLLADPDADFSAAVEQARRAATLRGAPIEHPDAHR